jgi:hypothetical protein
MSQAFYFDVYGKPFQLLLQTYFEFLKFLQKQKL